MRPFSWRFIRMWQRNRDVFFRLWHAEAPGFVVEPVLVLLAMGLGLGAYVGLIDGQEYIEFIAPGIIAAYAMFSASFECTYGTFFRMEYQRTFDAIIATPLNVEDVIAGEIFWGATRSLMTGTMILAVAAAFQLVHSPWALLIPMVCFLQGVMFASIAMLFTSVVPYIYSFNYYFTLFVTPMFFFSGVFFPLSSFPSIVQTLSWIVPLTPVVHLTRALISGE
ncbi:MAG: ABC transporter permease, partial [Dehalococcoidia bacterium]|nr:ABC transporter permease [Dehalococcoidia bacterium]